MYEGSFLRRPRFVSARFQGFSSRLSREVVRGSAVYDLEDRNLVSLKDIDAQFSLFHDITGGKLATPSGLSASEI